MLMGCGLGFWVGVGWEVVCGIYGSSLVGCVELW